VAKKTARVVAFLRGVADSATDTLKSELGPEYADLTAADLNPKRLLQRTVLRDVQTELAGVKEQVEGLKQDLDDQIAPLKDETITGLAALRENLVEIEDAIDDATAGAETTAVGNAADEALTTGIAPIADAVPLADDAPTGVAATADAAPEP